MRPKRNYKKGEILMTKSKKLLSVFLAVVMVLSSLMAGFYAIAADEGATEDTAVTDVETKISAFYDNRTYLFSTSNEERHKQAVADYNAALAALKALSEDQKLDLSVDYYGFFLYYVTQSVARDLNEGSASTTQYVDTTMNHFEDIESAAGALPKKYKGVYDVFKAFYSVVKGNASTVNWKDNTDAIAAYETWAKAVAGFDSVELAFSDLLSPSTNGFYIYGLNPDSHSERTLENLISYQFNIIQDNETEAGKNPSSVSKTTYITYSYSNKTAQWKADQNGATMLEGFQNYYKLVQSDRVDVANKALDELLALFETEYPGLTSAVNDVAKVGAALIADEDSADLDEIKAVIDKYNSLESSAATIASKFLGNSTLVLAAELNIPIVFDENTDALEAYNNPPSVKTYTGANLVDQMNAYINTALLNDFVEYVNGVDTDAVTDEIIAEVKSLYSQLSSDNKGNIPEDTFNKFVQIITPVKNPTDFADEIAAFRPTAFVRPTNSKVAWTEGGIQNFVDMLESLLGGFVNLEEILSDNLYTADIVNMIFDLYATLSHNTTDIEGLITLGEVISAVITKDAIVSALPEAKFEKAVEKIKAAVVDEADPEGTNILDKIAALELTAEDWGFTAGDRDGFIDALLAVIRPITQLLDPDAEIEITAMSLSIPATIGIRMFDYQITDDGNYTAGIYENLLPLLEQLGLNDLPTTEEYKANYYAVKKSSGAAVAADEFLRPIIESLFKNIVDPVAENPVNGLVDILPRLAYVVDGDRLNTIIQKVLSDQGKVITLGGIAAVIVGDDPLLDLTTLGLDLSTEAINNMIPDTIDIGALIGDGTELVLNIGDIPWSTLADCATLNAVPSKSIYNENVLLRTGDADSCFSTVFYWLFDVALADADTYNAIKGLIVGLVPDNLTTIINTVIAQVLDPIVAAGKVDGYGLLLDNVFIGAQPTGNEIWHVEAAAGKGGSISPSGTVAVKQADSQVFSVNANDGYTIASLTVNGQNIAAAKGAASYDYTVEGAKVTSADPANQNTTDVTIQVTFADESGKPGPGPNPTPDPDPSNPNENGGNNNSNSNNNNGGKLPVVNNNNPNLPNTGAAEVAGMSVLTVIIALAAGAAVWFILRKRIVKE